MNILKHLFLGIFVVFPVAVSAQSMMVLNGNQYARECQQNVDLASNLTNNMVRPSQRLLDPCDFVLENVALSPADRAATMNNRGILRYLTQDYDGAFADFDVASRVLPNNPVIRANRGNAFFFTGQLDAALQDYNDSLELGINRPHAVHSNMGIVYEEMGNLQAAEQQYLRALELEPGWEKAELLLETLRVRQQERREPGQPPGTE